MQMDVVKELIYSQNLTQVRDVLRSSTDAQMLHVFAFNYNWGNGFEIPQTILQNPACSLSTALLLFYMGDGFRYLSERPETSELLDWFSFIHILYTKIMRGTYQKNDIAFEVPLNKIQIFKLRKSLSEEEMIFISPIEGKNLNLSL